MKFIQPMIVTAMFLLTASPGCSQRDGIEWDMLNQEVMSLYQNGQYDRAVIVATKALEVAEKNAGKSHPDVATSLNNLGELYRAQGQYAQAESLYKRSLAISEKALGPDHFDVATSLGNLAALYYDQGQYARAEPLYKRSLAIKEKNRGPDHPDVATILNNLALLYDTQGQYALAEPLYKRSLAIFEKALGPYHPDVATSVYNLAELYRETKREYEAEKLERHAASRGQEISGAANWMVRLFFRENWGLILIFSAILTWGIGLAPPLLVRFAFMRKPMSENRAVAFVVAFIFVNAMIFTALGSESKTHLALLLVAVASYHILRRGAKKGKVNDSPPPEGACPLCGRTKYMLWARALYGHMVCKKCYYGFIERRHHAYFLDLMAWCLLVASVSVGIALAMPTDGSPQSDILNMAQVICWLTLPIFFCKDCFGGHSPGKLICGVRVIDEATGQPISIGASFKRNLPLIIPFMPFIVAFQLYKGHRTGDGWSNSKVIWKKYADHPIFCSKSRGSPGTCRLSSGQGEEDRRWGDGCDVVIAKNALEVAEKTLGPNHPDMATSLNTLARLYHDQGQYARAEPLYKRSLMIWAKALGADDPDVARSLENLAMLYRKTEREYEAEKLEKRAASIRAANDEQNRSGTGLPQRLASPC